MANKWHVDWISEGAKKWNNRRKKVAFSPDLSELDFFSLLPHDFRDSPKTSRYFEKFDLSRADLTNSDLSNLNFSKANFTDADLSGANLSKSNFSGAKFNKSKLNDVDASRALFSDSIFENAVLEGLSLDEAEMNGAVFINTPLSDTQTATIDAQAAEVYPNRIAYRDALDSTPEIAPRRPMVAGDSMEDNRTSKFKYDVYYGTTRQPVVQRGALVGFNEETNDRLSFGVCEVIVPDQHRIGRIGSWIWRKLTNRADRNLRIASIISLNEQLFFKHLIATSDKMTEKARPTVYIHGYNTSFEDAVLRAAEVGHGLGIGMGIGLFIWASKGSSSQYIADETTVDVSKYLLADFLENFVENGSEMGINVIAHSMGCRCLLGALEVLSAKNPEALSEIHQIIMAAADVDTKVMPYLGVHAIENAERITSYASGKDTALKASGWLHSFHRVGYTPPTFLLTGIDTIIVNDLDLGDFSHNYVAKSRTILSDIFQILKHGFGPDDRHAVDRIESTPIPHWKIRR